MSSGYAFFLVNLLKHKIKDLQNPIDESLVNSEYGEMLKLVYKQVECLEELSKITLCTDLEESMSGEVWELIDMVDEIDSKSEMKEEVIQNVKEKIDSFIPVVKMKEQECSDGLYNVSLIDDQDEDHSAAVSSEVMGVGDVYGQLKDLLMEPLSKVTSLVGMPGIGKTALANKLFHDPTVVERFDRRVWIRVGKRYRGKDIPRRMLEEIDPDGLQEGDEEAVAEQLKASLKSRRYLVVLDDVWDRFATHLLCPDMSGDDQDQPYFQRESGSRVLITSRLHQLDPSRGAMYAENIAVRLLNKEESWDLLRKLFFQGSCPPQFEKAGKKISENCEGLPLTILTVARLLSQDEEKSNPEYWDKVATEKNHPIFVRAYEEISKVLLPSYTYLPPLLQMCFMFIGLFRQKYEIPRSKLVNLWLADGFFELNVHIYSEDKVIEYLEELISNSVVMVYQQSTYNLCHKIKTFGLHSSLWHLSKRKATETKFALLLSSRNDGLGDGIDGHHRLSFLNNVLFGIKDVHKSVEDNCASAARSLFCFGPYHQYQVPLCFRLNLLRELDALSIRFYEFPVEVLQLVRLTYLSITLNGTIPTSISQLQLLEFLIVDRHQNIKSCKDASYLPVDIWSLQKLKHLQVMGSDLPDPCGASLSNLSTLSNISFHSCTTDVLEGIPNMRNLKIRIELAPDDDGKPFTYFGTHHISYLSELESFKCVIVNPEAIPPIAPFSSLLKGIHLRNLSLSGLGYPWKEMRNIASLPSLQVLKLKNYAFQGSNWEVEETTFNELVSLVIEDTDLVDWKLGDGVFGKLGSLKLKQCYKLQKIHGKFFSWLEMIELVDCNPSCVVEMKKIVNMCTNICITDILSSCDDRELKT